MKTFLEFLMFFSFLSFFQVVCLNACQWASIIFITWKPPLCLVLSWGLPERIFAGQTPDSILAQENNHHYSKPCSRSVPHMKIKNTLPSAGCLQIFRHSGSSHGRAWGTPPSGGSCASLSCHVMGDRDIDSIEAGNLNRMGGMKPLLVWSPSLSFSKEGETEKYISFTGTSGLRF